MIHGTRPAYIAGCRCEPCKAENARYMRRYRQRKWPKTEERLAELAYRRMVRSLTP